MRLLRVLAALAALLPLVLAAGVKLHAPQLLWTEDSADGGSAKLLTGDVNGDGLEDVVLLMALPSDGGQKVTILRSRGNGYFHPPVVCQFPTAGSWQLSGLVDLTGDGAADLWTVHQSDSLLSLGFQLYMLQASPNGCFRQPQLLYSSSSTPPLQGLLALPSQDAQQAQQGSQQRPQLIAWTVAVPNQLPPQQGLSVLLIQHVEAADEWQLSLLYARTTGPPVVNLHAMSWNLPESLLLLQAYSAVLSRGQQAWLLPHAAGASTAGAVQLLYSNPIGPMAAHSRVAQLSHSARSSLLLLEPFNARATPQGYRLRIMLPRGADSTAEGVGEQLEEVLRSDSTVPLPDALASADLDGDGLDEIFFSVLHSEPLRTSLLVLRPTLKPAWAVSQAEYDLPLHSAVKQLSAIALAAGRRGILLLLPASSSSASAASGGMQLYLMNSTAIATQANAGSKKSSTAGDDGMQPASLTAIIMLVLAALGTVLLVLVLGSQLRNREEDEDSGERPLLGTGRTTGEGDGWTRELTLSSRDSAKSRIELEEDAEDEEADRREAALLAVMPAVEVDDKVEHVPDID